MVCVGESNDVRTLLRFSSQLDGGFDGIGAGWSGELDVYS